MNEQDPRIHNELNDIDALSSDESDKPLQEIVKELEIKHSL